MSTSTEIKNGRVVRTFTGRTEYINEDRAYELLRGTGLAPKLLYSFDNCIEYQIPEGEILWDRIQDAKGDAAELSRLFGLWADWYDAFRKKTGFCLGGADLKDLVLTGDGLVCTDFQQCRKGYAECDIAAAVAQLCLEPHAFDPSGAALARALMKVAAGRLEYDPEILANHIRTAIKEKCRAAGIKADPTKTEYICTFSTMALLTLEGGRHRAADIEGALADVPEKANCSADGDLCAKLAESLEKIDQPWTFGLSTHRPALPPILIRAMICADKEGFEAVAVESEGKLRDFPMLLRTEHARYDMELAAKNGVQSAAQALKHRPVRIIRLEDLEGHQR